MYESFYKLREKPFSIVPNPEYLFLSQKHKNALTMLEYGLAENIGFILLTGEIGAGKTTLVKHMLGKLAADTESAVLFNTNVSSEELIRQILQRFDLTAEGADKAKHLETFYRYLIDRYAQGKQVLLIIDEAQNLPDEALEELRMLNNLQTEQDMLLKVLIVGQPELLARLKSPYHAPLSQRIAVRFHLRPLTRRETAEYIAWRLEKAGGKTNLFTRDAMDKIYDHSGGIPRAINLLCNAALVYGLADEKETIDVEVVDQVIGDEEEFSSRRPEIESRTKFEIVGEPPQGLDDRLEKRLESVEQDVREVHLELKLHLENLEQLAESHKDQALANMKDMLENERRRNDGLMISYTRLKDRFEKLQRMIAKATEGGDTGKKRFWKRG